MYIHHTLSFMNQKEQYIVNNNNIVLVIVVLKVSVLQCGASDLSIVRSNPIKGSCCFIEAETLTSLVPVTVFCQISSSLDNFNTKIIIMQFGFILVCI